MKLSENIRFYRKQAGLSQEQLAEKLDISRQAVAKWESGQSAPSTENLLRLCEILNVSLESLITAEPTASAQPTDKEMTENPPKQPDMQTTVEAVRAYEQQKTQSRRNRFYLNLISSLGVILIFVVIYLIDRLLHVDLKESTLTAFLFDRSPYHNSYLIGWLHHNSIYWICMGISIVGFLLNKRFFAYTVTAGFLLGLFLGILASFVFAYVIGYNFGWIFWSASYLFSIGLGLALQIAHSFGKFSHIKI